MLCSFCATSGQAVPLSRVLPWPALALLVVLGVGWFGGWGGGVVGVVGVVGVGWLGWGAGSGVGEVWGLRWMVSGRLDVDGQRKSCRRSREGWCYLWVAVYISTFI